MTPSPLPISPSPPMPIQPESSGYGNTGNPVLDEISAAHASLSPQAQQAIEGAHGMLGISPAHSDPALAASTAPSPVSVSGVSVPESPKSPFQTLGMIAGGPDQAMGMLAEDQHHRSSGPVSVPTPLSVAPAPAAAGSGPGTDTATAPPPVEIAAPRSGTAGMAAPPPLSPHQAEFNRLTAPPLPGSDPHAHTALDMGRPGSEQIHNPWLRGLATVGDVVASGLFPNFGQFIPGTSGYHNRLVASEKGALGEEQAGARSAADVAHTNAQAGLENAQTAGLPAESALKNAETQNYISEAEARKNPDLQLVAHPVIDPSDESKTPRTGYFNKKDGTMTYGPEVAAAPVAESNKPSIEKMDNGDVVAVHYDPATKKSSMEVVYHGDPKIETDITKLEVNGKPHSVVVNKKTGATIKDLGETGERPPTVNVSQGTWAIEEDADGKPIEYNSKTGETRAVAPGGVQKSGTKAKGDAAKQPAKDALNYAETYLQAPAHTGSGDEALQEKFFELAKPTTGFRMTQPQMDMLQNSRSWMGSLSAHVRHATTGTWFSDEQRAQIVQTMRDLAKAKGVGGGGGGGETSGDTVTVQLPDGRSAPIHASQKEKFLKDNPGSKVIPNAAK